MPPEQVPDVLALIGDTIDNVPGVPGIGEKGAQKLIQEYGSLEELLERAAEIKRKTYREGLSSTPRTPAVEGARHHPLRPADPVRPPGAAPRAARPAALTALFGELEFFSLLEEMENEGALSTAIEIAPARELDCRRRGSRRSPACRRASISR